MNIQTIKGEDLMIKTFRECEERWIVFNTKNGDCCDILRGYERMMGKTNSFYRADYRNETQKVTDHFQTA